MKQIKPKGTRDFLPSETLHLQILETLLKQACDTSCYREIRTPMFEHTEVYTRSSGEGSDIVNKEMYTFNDRGNRSISLRPEGTAGVIRAFVENKAYVEADLPIRLYYIGPNFRYERPQAGRFRQFTQLGVENIGIRSPYLDAEVIMFAVDMLASVGITNIQIKVNSIGDATSRDNYRQALKEYFAPYIGELCEDCKVRYEKNPLRILDCKVDYNHPCMKDYPRIDDYLSAESKEYFHKVLEILDNFEIKYTVDSKMVRGLDYYNDTVFEIYASSPSGVDYGAILAGGRYDNLVKEFEGPALPAFGFGMGIDRVNEICKELKVFEQYKDSITVYVMPVEECTFSYAYFIMNYLRINGVDADMDYQQRSMKSQFKTVDRKNATFSLIVGSTEMLSQSVTLKVNKTKAQKVVPLDQLINYINDIQDDLAAEECSCGHHHDEEGCCCGHHHEDGEECECGHHHEDGEECECGHHHEDGEECQCGHHHDKKDN